MRSSRIVLVVLFVLALAVGYAGMFIVQRWSRADRPSMHAGLLHAQLAVDGMRRAFDRDAFEAAALRANADDWWTYAHDQRRSGLERADTGITAQNAATLQLRWVRYLDEPVWSSPIAVGGNLYVATERGNVYALDAATGAVRWRRNVGISVHMTPALVDGRLLVGVYGANGESGRQPQGAAFVALTPATGAVLWRTALPGLVRSEPVVLDGRIYEGLAGGDDFSGCFDGRIIALDEADGALLPQAWYVTGRAHDGGGVWAPLSTDGRSIYVGTGNSCGALGADGAGDSIVALSPDLKLRWRVAAFWPGVDDSDVGGGVNVAGDHAFVAAKNGMFYEIDRATGRLVRRTDLRPFARNGGSIGTPTGDGGVLVISSGALRSPWAGAASLQTAGGDLIAFDRRGNERYRLHSGFPIQGYAAFVRGVGFAALDRHLVAFDARSGSRLWSAPLDAFAYPSPIVVPSGVYAATSAGSVFAFGIPGATRAPGQVVARQ